MRTAECAYRHSVNAFGVAVVSSVAGVAGVVATVVFGILPYLRRRRVSAAVTAGGAGESGAGRAVGSGLAAALTPPLLGGVARGLLPARNRLFTGRIGVLEDVRRRLAAGPAAVVAVRGLGGVGKSQVALEYAYRSRDEGRYRMTGWVRADSPVTIAEDLAALAPQLGMAAEGPVGDVAGQVVAALESRRDWLLVFDNAQNPEDLAGFLPSGGGDVLITSRSRVWSGLAAQLDLEVFTRAESVEFLCQRSGRAEHGNATELAELLGDLPLALAQAAAYIDIHAISIGSYLDLYRDQAIARRLREEGLQSGEYPASVARTWVMHFDRLRWERPAAVELLRLCAYLDPDNIDLGLLSAGAATAGEVLAAVLADPLERTETAGALAQASLVTAVAEGQLRVHRLVQAVTRDQLDADQAAAWIGRALRLISEAFPEHPDDHRSWSLCGALSAHAEAVTSAAQPYPDLAEATSDLLNLLGIYLAASAQLPVARATLERALAIEENAYGPDHRGVARTLDNLGAVELELGDLPAARATLERALAIGEAAYGPDHPEVAKTLINLGSVQRELGDLPAARATLERALAIVEAAYGPDHSEVAAALTNLGIVEVELGNLDAARATLERALAIVEAAYGPDHPGVARNLGNLANVELVLGNLDAARTTVERALAIIEAAYGPDHPGVATMLGLLGGIQQKLGNRDAARATLERALAVFQAVYGPDHPDTQKALSVWRSLS